MNESSASHQKPLVSVVTPTIQERAHYLRECVKSVEAQTFRGFEHIIWEDSNRAGNSVTVNRAASRAHGEWILSGESVNAIS